MESLYHLFMVNLGVVYHCFTNIIDFEIGFFYFLCLKNHRPFSTYNFERLVGFSFGQKAMGRKRGAEMGKLSFGRWLMLWCCATSSSGFKGRFVWRCWEHNRKSSGGQWLIIVSLKTSEDVMMVAVLGWQRMVLFLRTFPYLFGDRDCIHMHEDTIHDLMIMRWHHDYVSLCIFKKQICKWEFPTLCFLPFPRHQCCQQECHCKFSCTHSCRTMSMRLSRWLLGGRSFCHRVENRTCRCARFLRQQDFGPVVCWCNWYDVDVKFCTSGWAGWY